jgi:hypothetical protein
MVASGNVLYERERTAQGGYFVWLDESVVNNLERLRGPRDEDLSAVIVPKRSASRRRLRGNQSPMKGPAPCCWRARGNPPSVERQGVRWPDAG